MDLGITAYSAITPKGVLKNGDPVYINQDNAPFNAFAKETYKAIDPAYSKFFKMDELCKLAFLATEVLLSEKPFAQESNREDIAVILGNKNSSIASDQKHYDSYKDRDDYFPSPAVFVYTLPNIMLGEICIRHNITGENTCFLMDHFNADFLFQYVKELFLSEQYRYCITGWIDYSDLTYSAHLFLVEKWDKDRSFIKKFDSNFNNNINGAIKG